MRSAAATTNKQVAVLGNIDDEPCRLKTRHRYYFSQ
jgi:hypothetical protein